MERRERPVRARRDYVNLVFNRDEQIAAWVSEKLGQSIVQPFTTLGWVDQFGRPGGCVFNNKDAANIDLTFAMDGLMDRGVMRAIAHYVFIQSGCARVTMKTRKSNERAIRAARIAGFEFETNLERWYGAEDGVQFKMTSDRCRWI